MATTVTTDVPLSTDSIGDLDGGIARMVIDAEISKAVQDLRDRGEEDKKVRKVVIQLELVIHKGLVVVDVAAEAKLPPRRTNSTATKIKFTAKDHADLFFQPKNPQSPEQPTLQDGTEE